MCSVCVWVCICARVCVYTRGYSSRKTTEGLRGRGFRKSFAEPYDTMRETDRNVSNGKVCAKNISKVVSRCKHIVCVKKKKKRSVLSRWFICHAGRREKSWWLPYEPVRVAFVSRVNYFPFCAMEKNNLPAITGRYQREEKRMRSTVGSSIP